MDTADLIETLRSAGLSPYQAEAYVALLEQGSISAQDLAKSSSVPGPRIYDVLESLEEKGYVVTYERDQLYAEALDPEEGLRDMATQVTQFQSAISEIQSRWKQPDDASIDISVVKQFQTVLGKTKERIIAAEHQILLTCTQDQYFELQSALRSAFQRGVSVQVAIHSSDKFDASEDIFSGVCSEVRFSETPCMYIPFLTIVDGVEVCFAPFSRGPVQTQNDSQMPAELRYGVIVSDAVNAYVFEWYFLAALWETAEKVFSARSETPPIEFVDIREAIRLIDPLLRDGATVDVNIEGRRVSTGRRQTLSGRVSSVHADSSASPEGLPMQSLLTREATLVIQTNDGEVSVGGRGAVNEDVEATRVTVTAISD